MALLILAVASNYYIVGSSLLKKVCIWVIGPLLEYVSAAWSTSTNTHLLSLSKVSNEVLRDITRAMKSTPFQEMQSYWFTYIVL